MNKLEIDNLIEIVKLEYPHICLHPHDLVQFTTIPAQNRKYYPCLTKSQRQAGKRGHFNNGKTLCWASWFVKLGYIKVAFKDPSNVLGGAWSEELSFQEEGTPLKIYKLIKLKAFGEELCQPMNMNVQNTVSLKSITLLHLKWNTVPSVKMLEKIRRSSD